MNNRVSLDSAVLLAGITAILYTWSTAYYHGFLSVLHLDADMMERSFHQVIYSGLLISFAPVLLTLIFFTFLLYIYSHGILPGYVDWARGSVSAKRKAIKFRRFWFGKRNSPPIEIRAKRFFTRVVVVSVFGIFYVVSLVIFEDEGKSKANDLLKSHLEGKNKSTQMVSATIYKKEKNLLFLGCGTRNCAGIEEGSNLIFYYASSKGYSYLQQEKNVTSQVSGTP